MISLVVEAVVRSMALGLMLWLALSLTRSRNPHLHKMLWSTVLLASLAIPFLMRTHVTPVIQAPDYVLTLRGGGVSRPAGASAWSGASVLYASIALTLLLRYTYSLFRMWRIRRNARVLHEVWTAGLDVRVTTQISCPATFGSTILLPPGFTEWSAQKLRAVIAHEHSHVLHKDCYVFMARAPAYMPVLGKPTGLVDAAAPGFPGGNHGSDEAAVTVVEDRARYAEILLEFAQQRAASAVATAMARPKISGRIDRILSGIAPSTVPRLSKRMLVLARATAGRGRNSRSCSPRPHQARAADHRTRRAEHQNGSRARRAREVLSEGCDASRHRGPGTDPGHTGCARACHRHPHPVRNPLDMGFGAAASTLAHQFEYNNPGNRPAQLTFNVKFALAHSGPGGTTNFEGPDIP